MTTFNDFTNTFNIDSLHFLILSKNPTGIDKMLTFNLKNNSISYINQAKKQQVDLFLDTNRIKLSGKSEKKLSSPIKHKFKSNFNELIKRSKVAGITMNSEQIKSFLSKHNLKKANNSTLDKLNELKASITTNEADFTCIVSQLPSNITDLLLNETLEPAADVQDSSIFSIKSFHQDCLDLLNSEDPEKKKLIIKTKNPETKLTIDNKEAIFEEIKGDNQRSKITCNFDEQALYLNSQKQSEDFIAIFHKKIQSIYKANSENRSEFLEEV